MTPADFNAGDLLLFWGRTWQSRVIETVTRGPSHVGICTKWYHPRHEWPLLFESTTLCELPDILSGEKIQGVQAHDPAARVKAYDGRVARMRLRIPLTCEQELSLRNRLYEIHGRPYDLRGAIESGTRLFKWTAWMPYPDLGHLFCSELVAEQLMQLLKLPLGDPGIYNPATLMREVQRCASYLAPEDISNPLERLIHALP